MPDHERVVRDVLAAASLPQPKSLVRAVEGVGNHVFFAGDVVVRLGTGSDGVKFPRSAAVLAAARPSVRVPELVYIDASCTTHPVPVMVLARMPGEPLSRHFGAFDDVDRRHVLEQIAVELQAVHALSPSAIPKAAFADPWWAERTTRIEGWLRTLPTTTDFPRACFDRMERYLDQHRSALEDAPAGVLHNDVHWENVLVEGRTVTALLDFDDALAGPAEEDAWALVHAVEESDPLVAPEVIAALPGFDLGAAGVLERYRIAVIENILELLSGDLSWVSPEHAQRDARLDFAYAFDSRHYDRMRARYLR